MRLLILLWLGLLTACATPVEPIENDYWTKIQRNTPNPVFQGPYPPKFQNLQSDFPRLAEELGRLPELQDGLSSDESAVLEQISELYLNDKETFRSAFERMDGVGLPDVRKFNILLETLFWLVEDGDTIRVSNLLNDISRNIYLNHLNTYWRATKRDWSSLDVLADRLNSPELILHWMQANISYGHDGDGTGRGWKYRSPEQVLELREGDSASWHSLGRLLLLKNGYDAHLLFVNRPKIVDHGILVWLSNDGFYQLELAFGGHEGIYGPHPSLKKIGKVNYKWLVAKDGKSTGYSLKLFNSAKHGMSWERFERSHTPIPQRLSLTIGTRG